MESIRDTMRKLNSCGQLSRFSIIQHKVALFLSHITNHSADVKLVGFRCTRLRDYDRLASHVSVAVQDGPVSLALQHVVNDETFEQSIASQLRLHDRGSSKTSEPTDEVRTDAREFYIPTIVDHRLLHLAGCGVHSVLRHVILVVALVNVNIEVITGRTPHNYCSIVLLPCVKGMDNDVRCTYVEPNHVVVRCIRLVTVMTGRQTQFERVLFCPREEGPVSNHGFEVEMD
mmetsp:Transcript_18396/g.31600  ORF Transcript_18396/g.31600 Transcript_18396/m.31600 type:complete len:230 (-) Transcript_18396:1041-1730(-)